MSKGNRRQLQRSRNDRWFTGVCGGLGEYFGISSGLMRGLTVFSFFISGSMTFWAYIIMSFVLRSEPKAKPQASQQQAYQHYANTKNVPVQNLGQRKLERVVASARQHAPLEIQEQVESIYGTARTLMPEIESGKRKMRPVREAVMEYFPDTLESYLRLPADYAESYVLPDGNTPKEKLLQDLEVINDTLRNMAASNYQKTVQRGSRGLDELRKKLDTDPMRDVRRSLQKLEEQVDASTLSDEALEKIHNISVTIQALLPQLLRSNRGDYNVYNVRQTALEYLPDAVNKYLDLPADFAQNHVLSNGKTAYQTFIEQLNLLEDTVRSLMTSAYQDDANGLMVHGRFLAEKFANQSLNF